MSSALLSRAPEHHCTDLRGLWLAQPLCTQTIKPLLTWRAQSKRRGATRRLRFLNCNIPWCAHSVRPSAAGGGAREAVRSRRQQRDTRPPANRVRSGVCLLSKYWRSRQTPLRPPPQPAPRPSQPARSARVASAAAPAAMLFVLSPAKTLDEAAAVPKHVPRTEPRFAADADALATQLAALSPAALRELLSVNAALAELNRGRYAKFASAMPKQCVLAYNGPAYKALKAAELTAEQLDWVQRRLCVPRGARQPFPPTAALTSGHAQAHSFRPVRRAAAAGRHEAV